MKKLILIFLTLISVSLKVNAAPSLPHYGVGFNFFYYSLEPYGRWIELNDGIIVWKPFIRYHRWSPYTRGSWIYTNYGWYWDSYEPFGFVVYHYGRWFYDDYYGWIWIPDYEWAPSWVDWRYDDDYIGWAPLPPYAHFSINIGITFSHHYSFGYRHWNFVRYRNFCNSHVNNYFIDNTVKYRVFSNTKERRDYRYNSGEINNRGLEREFIENRSGVKLRENNLIIRNRDNGRNPVVKTNDQIEIFRPKDEIKTDRTKSLNIYREERTVNLDRSKVISNEQITRDVNNFRKSINSESDNRNITTEREKKINTRVNENNSRTNERTEIKTNENYTPKILESQQNINERDRQNTRTNDNNNQIRENREIRTNEMITPKMQENQRNNNEREKINSRMNDNNIQQRDNREIRTNEMNIPKTQENQRNYNERLQNQIINRDNNKNESSFNYRNQDNQNTSRTYRTDERKVQSPENNTSNRQQNQDRTERSRNRR